MGLIRWTHVIFSALAVSISVVAPAANAQTPSLSAPPSSAPTAALKRDDETPAASLALSDSDVKRLLDETSHNGRTIFRRYFDYTWTMRFVTRSRSEKGGWKEEARVVEVYPRYGHQAERVLSINGKVVSNKDRRKNDERLGKELAADEQKRTEQAATPEQAEVSSEVGDKHGRVRLSFHDFVRAGEFTNPRRVTFHGRPAVLLDFRPRAAFAPSDKRIAPLAHLVGRLWIDEADKQFARLEAYLSPRARTLLEAQREADAQKSVGEKRGTDLGVTMPGADEPVMVDQQVRLPDGMWIRDFARINALAAPGIFNGNKFDWQFESYDFKRFDTNAGGFKAENTNR